MRGRAEAVTAWRFWEVAEVDGEPFLCSPFRSVVWPVGEPLQAECLSLRLAGRSSRLVHDAPAAECRCGIYGGTHRGLRSFLRTKLVRASAPVLGRVLLWGDVVADDYGWRASVAYPASLLVSTLVRNSFAIGAALEAYGVPVEIADAGQTYATLNPSTRVRAVR